MAMWWIKLWLKQKNAGWKLNLMNLRAITVLQAFFTLCLLQALTATIGVAADWPQWMGPRHNGTTNENQWSIDRTRDAPETVWQASVGIGFASMAISEGRLVTAGHEGGSDTVWCFAADSGKLIWQYTYPCPLWAHEHEGGPSATATIVKKYVYTLSKEGHLICFDVRDGSVIWQINIRQQFNVLARPSEPQRDYGYAGSPLVVGQLLVVPVGGKNANTVAFDKDTGEIIWTSGNVDGNTGAGYATPVAFSWDNRDYLAVLAMKDLEILELKTGRQVASYNWPTPYGNNIPTPCIAGNRIFITADYGAGCAAIDFDGQRLEEVFYNKDIMCKMTNPLLLEGHIYAGTSSGVIKCMELATGEICWQQRLLGNTSLLRAGERFLCLGENGELVEAVMTPEGFQELARTKTLDGKCWTMPVLCNGLLYVRDVVGNLICLNLRSAP